MTVWYVPCALWQLKQISAFRETQQELQEEKNAQESLIAMLCDSSLRMALDGDTILQSTPLFDNMLKQDAKGTPLKAHLPSGQEEAKRLAEAFARARLSPVALPVTFISMDQMAHRAELFIVRHR